MIETAMNILVVILVGAAFYNLWRAIDAMFAVERAWWDANIDWAMYLASIQPQAFRRTDDDD